jgi:hypothetical protein
LRQWCVQAADRLNQDGTEPDDTVAQRQRGLHVIDQPDGTAKLTGRLTAHAAAALRAILGPLSAPAPAADGTRDERTAAQRRHDGLAEACSRLLRSGTLPATGGAETTILVTIDYRDLLQRYWNTTTTTTTTTNSSTADSSERDSDSMAGSSSAADAASGSTANSNSGSGASSDNASNTIGSDAVANTNPREAPNTSAASGYGVTSYGTLIPVDELLRRAGEANIIPVILNDTGGIMAYGRSRRLASPAQRRALAARDGGCVRPGCTAPADWCQVNHIRRWEHGGRTDIGEMVLVCPFDHDELDRGASIVMINGRAHWIEPPWLDPAQTPRLNTAHHIPRLLNA